MHDTATLHLVDFAQRSPKPLLVWAHPGSGTGFASELLKRAGLDVHHETIRGPLCDRSVVVSYRYWPNEDVEGVFRRFWAGPVEVARLIRDPVQTVYSCSAMAAKHKRPKLMRAAFEQFVPTCRDNVWLRKELWPVAPDNPAFESAPLRALAASVAGFHMSTGGYGRVGHVRTFRVEDLPVPEGMENYNRHNHDPSPSWELWDRLGAELDPQDPIDRMTWEYLSGLHFAWYAPRSPVN